MTTRIKDLTYLVLSMQSLGRQSLSIFQALKTLPILIVDQ